MIYHYQTNHRSLQRHLKILLSLPSLLFSVWLFGQEPSPIPSGRCETLITDAERSFDNGLYEDCINSLESALKNCELSRKGKEHAMELLAKSYVEVKDPVKAESAVGSMLKKYPYYELNENANFETYNRLVKKYEIHPAFSVGIRNVILWVGCNTTRIFTIPDGPNNMDPYKNTSYFFTYYGWAEFEFYKNLSINGDLMWWTSYYEKEFTKEPDFDLHFEEWPEFVEIPIYLKKYFPVGKSILPYVAAGAGWLYMTKAVANVSRYDRNDGIIYFENDINMLPMRTRHNFEWMAGAGIGYKFKSIRMFLDMRYYGGLTSLTDPNHRLDNETLVNDYYYVDNSLQMNKFEMGASISYTFINSVKRIRK